MVNFNGKTGKIKIGTAKSISDANHSGGVVTIDFGSAHGFVAGDRIIIEGVVGMTSLNTYHTVATAPDADTITVALTTAQSYTSGGTAIRHVPIISGNVTGNTEMLPASDSESGDWEEFVAGRNSFTCSFEGYAKEGASIPVEGDSLTITVEIDPDNYFSGTMKIESVEINNPIAEGANVTFTVAARGTGEKTKTLDLP
jgi:hypothetical protein